jgi:outer membrane immunogenic protein
MAAGLITSAGSAMAADLAPMPVKAPQAVVAAPSWTGFYIGGDVGRGSVVHEVSAGLLGATATLDGIGGQGFLGGVYGGFDYQVAPQFVVGIMADGTWSNIDSKFSASAGAIGLDAKIRADVSWSVLARLGWLSSPATLWYVLGGYTWQNFHTTVSAPGLNLTRDDSTDGWTVGGGVETRLFGNWFTGLEYRYTHLQQRTFLGGVIGIQPTMQTVRTTLSYKFGSPVGPGAAAAFTPAVPATWTGFYIGGAGGGGTVTHKVDVSILGAAATLDGVGGEGGLASVYGGFDYQISPRFVVGVLADGTWSDIESTLSANAAGATINGSIRADESWSAGGRIGWLSNPSTMWYVLGAYTWQNFHTSASATAGGATVFSASRDDSTSGWTLGSGVEAALSSNWFAKFEYRYTRLDEKTFFGGAIAIQPTIQTIRAGISYKFNLGGGAPIRSRM